MFNTLKEMLTLREMTPQLELKELPYYMERLVFYSNETLSSEYNVLFKEKISARGVIVIAIKKDNSKAIIGKITLRPKDRKDGIYVFGELTFKQQLDIGENIPSNLMNKKVFQVDGVEILKELKRQGYGYLLYFILIRLGYIIICDNVQYLGGQALWKKIANEAKFNNYQVYVMDNGIFRKRNNKYVFYNGTNIQDSELWSNNYEKYHTLFVAVSN